MPWPENYCEGHSDTGSNWDTVQDPDTCQCFYHCNGEDEVSGHACCGEGLVYNPQNGLCDWPTSVPGCEDGIPKI